MTPGAGHIENHLGAFNNVIDFAVPHYHDAVFTHTITTNKAILIILFIPNIKLTYIGWQRVLHGNQVVTLPG